LEEGRLHSGSTAAVVKGLAVREYVLVKESRYAGGDMLYLSTNGRNTTGLSRLGDEGDRKPTSYFEVKRG
jgi:hypothetical protein